MSDFFPEFLPLLVGPKMIFQAAKKLRTEVEIRGADHGGVDLRPEGPRILAIDAQVEGDVMAIDCGIISLFCRGRPESRLV